jgi:hypothetical protein
VCSLRWMVFSRRGVWLWLRLGQTSMEFLGRGVAGVVGGRHHVNQYLVALLTQGSDISVVAEHV